MISDEPVNLNEIDLLGSKKYSDLLKSTILNSPENKSVTIGLFGEWGSGKSSIIKTVQIDLESDSDVKFITYDSWKYTNDGFRRTFLMHIRDEFESKKIPKTTLENRFYSNISEIKYRTSVLISFILAIFLIIVLQFVGLNFETSLFYSFAISFSILVLTCIIQILPNYVSNATIQKLHYFSPEQFENDFKILVKEAETKKSIKKIVIVIDNLDRCPQNQTYTTLTDVRGFLDDQTLPVVFLIPVDDNALSIQIKKYGDKPAEFLRKIFDTVIHVKPFRGSNMYDFVYHITDKEKLDLKSDTMYLVAEEFVTNPRRIIRLLSNLQEELNFFDRFYNTNNDTISFSKENETLICKLLIIREEWPEFYSEISKYPENLTHKTLLLNEFNWFGDSLQAEIEKRKDLKEQNLIKFLENTRAITKNIDDEFIRKLTTSHNSFAEIPSEIYAKLKETQYDEETFQYIDDDYNFSLLCNYLISELKIGIQRSAYETKVPEIFDIFLKINNHRSIKKYNIQIENCIGEYSTLIGFITSINEINNFVRYMGELKENHNNSYLFDFTVNELNLIYEDTHSIGGKFYTDLFIAIANEYPNDSICEKIQIGFAKKYSEIIGSSNHLGDGKIIHEERIQKLVSDELIELFIIMIGSDEDGRIMYDLEYISKIYVIKNEQIDKISTKLNALCVNPQTKGKWTTEEMQHYQQNLIRYSSFADLINRNLKEKKIVLYSNGQTTLFT